MIFLSMRLVLSLRNLSKLRKILKLRILQVTNCTIVTKNYIYVFVTIKTGPELLLPIELLLYALIKIR